VRAPIAGVVAGLRAASHDVCVFLPVDCPLIRSHSLLRLAAEAPAAPPTGPLPGAYPKALLPLLAEKLARGDYSLRNVPVMIVEPSHRRTEIGWTWLERSQWGTGANIETKYLLLRHAFESWGAMRVEFKTDARNLRVRGALLGIGATFEGIFRKHMVLPDSIRDSAWYAIVDDDWPAVKALLEAKIDRHVTALTE